MNTPALIREGSSSSPRVQLLQVKSCSLKINQSFTRLRYRTWTLTSLSMPKVWIAWLSLASSTSDTSNKRHHIRGSRDWTRKMTKWSKTPARSASSNGNHLTVTIHRWETKSSPILHLGHQCKAHWTLMQTRCHRNQATKEVSSKSVGCATLKAGGLPSKVMRCHSVTRKTASIQGITRTIWLLERTY